MDTPEQVLEKYWNYTSFRPLQKQIIESVLKGSDTLALLPTGGGKSICFQVPGLCMKGICLVVSPLIALMKDQVMNLKNRGIQALSIHSGMNFYEIKKTLENAAYGNFKFLYVSPERLETELFLDYLPILNIELIAVDEAHCISQWGHEFRPSYLNIANIRELLPNVPVLALTASATFTVQKDICENLRFRKNTIFQQSFDRPNLSYSSFQVQYKQNKLVQILKNVEGSAIVYCRSRKRTSQLAEILMLNGIDADHYHAGLSYDIRNERQNNWIKNTTRVIVCTNAFGMGIDKPDVRIVVHYDVPEALEHYYQEAGRAGRDGKKSYAVLLHGVTELVEMEAQAQVKYPPMDMIRKVYGALCNYFQLPAGKGEGLSFDFDLAKFVKRFKLDALVVNHVLKILEQEDLLTYSEQFFMPSTVVFTTGKRELETFLNTYPNFDPVVKGLLRSYEGIFDFPAPIHEDQLAKFISQNKEKVISLLHDLSVYKIIEYSPQKDSPQIYFIHDRVKADQLQFNQKNLLKRKNGYLKRLEAMERFTINKSLCRSKMIGLYFNAPIEADCGICDNCIRRKKNNINSHEFKLITEAIEMLIASESSHTNDLYGLTSSIPAKKTDQVLKWMQSENKISVDQEGYIKKKGPR